MLALLRTIRLLTWSLLRVVVARALGRSRGLEAFRLAYQGDGLLPVTPEERAFLDEARGCIACGLCAIGGAASAARGTEESPMPALLTSTKSMPDFALALDTLARLDEDTLARLELECPARVPMRDLVRFARTKGEALARIR